MIELIYDDPAIGVKNWAWLPLGGYLRAGDACDSLPSLELGVRAGPESSFEAYDGLPLVPAPTHLKPALGTVRAEGLMISWIRSTRWPCVHLLKVLKTKADWPL